jgi:hypothetical protein
VIDYDDMVTGQLDIEVAILLRAPSLERVTEARLAEAIRRVNGTAPLPALALAIIKSLEDPNARVRLKVVQGRRGAPGTTDAHSKALGIANYVENGLKAGVKQEALIAEICQSMDLSRATAMVLLKRGRKFIREMPEVRAFLDRAREEQRLKGLSK